VIYGVQSCFAEATIQCVGDEIVEGNAADDRRKRGWDSGLAGIGKVQLTVDEVAMNLRVECGLNLGRGAGKLDCGASAEQAGDGKSLIPEPFLDRIRVSLIQTELAAKLLRRQVAVKLRGCRILHSLKKILQSGFPVR